MSKWNQFPLVLAPIAGAIVLAKLVFAARNSIELDDGYTDTSTPANVVVPLVTPSDRVLLVGDSLAVGLNKPMKDAATASGNAFNGKGVTGSRIDEWSKKYLDPELNFNPTVVLVSLGTNDMKMLDPSTSQAPHVQAMINKVHAKGARIIWILPPTMPFDDKGVRAMVEAQVPDAVIHAEHLELPRAGDGIHMTPSGYTTFAQSVWQCVTAGTCS